MHKQVSKTQMFKLLRLLEFGAVRDDVIREAWNCWRALTEEQQTAMLHDKAASAADLRRARLWNTAWDGGMEYVLTVQGQ